MYDVHLFQVFKVYVYKPHTQNKWISQQVNYNIFMLVIL